MVYAEYGRNRVCRIFVIIHSANRSSYHAHVPLNLNVQSSINWYLIDRVNGSTLLNRRCSSEQVYRSSQFPDFNYTLRNQKSVPVQCVKGRNQIQEKLKPIQVSDTPISHSTGNQLYRNNGNGFGNAMMASLFLCWIIYIIWLMLKACINSIIV